MPGIKTLKEIEKITKACQITDQAFSKIIAALKKGKFKTEKQVASFFINTIKEQGGYPAFRPIIASGKNSVEIHHRPSGKLKKGFLIIDIGATYKKYRADMTRTVYLGKPAKKEVEPYNLLLKVQKNAIEQTRLNKKFSTLEKAARKQLGKYNEYFTHRLGHGVGLKVHEAPDFRKHKIQNNQVFTIEPGIYIPDKFGIRIEDTVLFKGKPIILTKSPKDLIKINY